MYNNLSDISDLLQEFDGLVSILSNVDDSLSQINETCQTLSNNLVSINSVGLDTFLTQASSIVGIVVMWSDFIDALIMVPAVMSLATTATTALTAAINFLTGPVGIAIAAMGLLVGAFCLFGDTQSESEKEMVAFSETQQKQREEIDKTTQSLKDNAIATEKATDAINADYSLTLGQIDQLVQLSGTDGYAGNIEKAKYLVDEINKVLPNSVELAENGKVVWKDINGEITDNIDAIKLSIEALKQRAIVEEYQQKYLEAIKEESKITTEKALAETNLAEAKKRYQELQLLGNDLSVTERKEKEMLCIQIEDYQKKIGSCNLQLAEIDDATNDYIASQQTLSGTTADMANFMVEQFIKLDENGKVTWESMGTGIVTLDAKLKAHYDGTRVMTEQEVAASKLARESLVNDMLIKAEQSGLSYETMLSTLKEKNISMTEEEKKQLKMRFDLWSTNDKDLQKAQQIGLDTMKLARAVGMNKMNENDQNKLSENVKLFAEKGDASGIELCNKLASSLEANNGEVDDETKSIMAQIEARAKAADPTAQVNVDGPTDKNIANVNSTIDKTTANRKAKVTVEAETNSKTISIFGFKIPWFADGGFPEMGQLFVAREAGPELVGRINGKTAVANNDQIVSGISSGVYNAVRSAMAGNGGNGNMNIHATFVMDGDVVGKQVIKYHNGVVKRTGTTPLMI